jgi:predicted transposase/invertase (TIGR01784 family)
MISAQKQTEFYHSDYDNLKKVRSIWICMDNSENGDSIEEVSLTQNVVFGNKKALYDIDLIRGIIINVRNGYNLMDSQNTLISMLEKLLSQISVEEKKRILTEEYGMIMTTELEGRIRTMCNLSENIKELGIEEGIEKGIQKGIEKGIEKERLNAIQRMMDAGLTKDQIMLCGYTKDELEKAGSACSALWL